MAMELEDALAGQIVDTSRTLDQVVAETPFWRPFQADSPNSIRRSFNACTDATYDTTDDIASLVRCRDQMGKMRGAIAESRKIKYRLQDRPL